MAVEVEVWGLAMDGERKGVGAEERRWDSVRRRWRARSLVARADSVAERGSVGLAEGGWRGVWEEGVGSGGLGVCEGGMLELVLLVRTGGWGWEEEGGGGVSTMNVLSSDFGTTSFPTLGRATCSITGTACPFVPSKPSHSESSASLAPESFDATGAWTICRGGSGLYFASKCLRKRACRCSVEAASVGSGDVGSLTSARRLRFPDVVVISR